MLKIEIMKIKILLLSIIIALSASNLSAQVTIGSGEDPVGGALLDLKQEDNNGAKNSALGLKIPRVKLVDVNELYPMYGTTGSEDATYTANKSSLKAANKGLMVYNMSEESGMLKGMYIWDGEQWMNFKSRNLDAPEISELLCDAAYMDPETYVAGVPFTGVLRVPYLDGNGAFHSETDIPSDNGLTFTLQPSQLADGAGILVYKVSGTPVASSPVTTTIPISFLGKSCNVTVGTAVEKELRYLRKMTPLVSETNVTTENSEVYVGNLRVRFNYDASRSGSNWIEFKVDMPAHVSYFYDKEGYATYGQYDASENVWYTFTAGNNTSYKSNSMFTDGNLSENNRDIATALVIIQRDDNRDVYRLTMVANKQISASGYPTVPAAVNIYVERLATEINYKHL